MKVMTVKGTFNNVKGEVVVDESNLNKSIVTAEVDAKTVNTGNNKRDEHLRTADFLDVATHSRMKFTSIRLEVDKGRLKIHGNLTIRGITRNVVLDAGVAEEIETELKGTPHCRITATTDINRNDFGVNNNKVLTYGIGDKVYLTLNIELIRAK
jgi:polyisoprenoid-binding protein YceI